MLQKRHSGKDASKKTLWKWYFKKDTLEKMLQKRHSGNDLKKRHSGNDTSKKTLWKRCFKQDHEPSNCTIITLQTRHIFQHV
jgi:hypothetical protein